jgi:hypothetical protein
MKNRFEANESPTLFRNYSPLRHKSPSMADDADLHNETFPMFKNLSNNNGFRGKDVLG